LDGFEPEPVPVIIHGDLWSGNVAGNKDSGSPVIFDPSSCWGHNEYELGVCHMFGGEFRRFDRPTGFDRNSHCVRGVSGLISGFTKEFFDAYHSVHPRSEPHHDQRIKLYELYHLLNVRVVCSLPVSNADAQHTLMFGGGYKSGALSIMRSLNEYASTHAQ
jgi:fructosamine-3-kinase